MKRRKMRMEREGGGWIGREEKGKGTARS